MAALVIERAATNFPVTLQEAKTFCRVDFSDDDALLNILIEAATRSCEIFTNRSFCYKGFRQSLDSFPYYTDTVMSQMAYPPSYYALPRYSTTLWNYSQMIKLLRPPLVSVDGISYLSSSDSQWHDLVPVPPLWKPGTDYPVDSLVMDNNANVQKVIAPGVSNANPPTSWSKEIGGQTAEAQPDPFGEGTGIIWANQGPFANIVSQFGSFIVDHDSEPARIFPGPPGNFWPSVLYVPNAVQIHFTAGYSEDGNNVPGTIKTAILQCVNHWYENREITLPGAAGELPHHVKLLLWNERVLDMQPTRG